MAYSIEKDRVDIQWDIPWHTCHEAILPPQSSTPFEFPPMPPRPGRPPRPDRPRSAWFISLSTLFPMLNERGHHSFR